MEFYVKKDAKENLQVYTLFSGSKGNSVFIRNGDDGILIDVGMSAKATNDSLISLGYHLSRISAAFITHEHIDHIRGAEVISKRYEIKIHAAGQSARYIRCNPECLCPHGPEYRINIGSMEITSFVTPHDSATSVGYLIRTEQGTIGIATDLGHLPDRILGLLTGCNAVILESNHDIAMLNNGSYPKPLKERILSPRGHLSNKDCARAVAQLAKNGVESVLLAHLSAENNTPQLALEASAGLCEQLSLYHTSINIAAPDTPTRLI